MTKIIGKAGREADFKAANLELLKHIDLKDLVKPKNLTTKTDLESSNITLMVFNPQKGIKEAKTFTWHHHENAKTMMLVEQDVHFSITHDGGHKMKDLNAANKLDDLAEFIFGNPIFK